MRKNTHTSITENQQCDFNCNAETGEKNREWKWMNEWYANSMLWYLSLSSSFSVTFSLSLSISLFHSISLLAYEFFFLVFSLRQQFKKTLNLFSAWRRIHQISDRINEEKWIFHEWRLDSNNLNNELMEIYPINKEAVHIITRCFTAREKHNMCMREYVSTIHVYLLLFFFYFNECEISIAWASHVKRQN